MPQIHRECLRYLRRICGRQAPVPRSLVIPLCYDPNENLVYHGGFADVWKGWHHGQEVAAKVVRVYMNHDFEQTRRVGCHLRYRPSMCIHKLILSQRFCREVVTWKTLRHPNVLPLLGVTMVGSQRGTYTKPAVPLLCATYLDLRKTS